MNETNVVIESVKRVSEMYFTECLAKRTPPDPPPVDDTCRTCFYFQSSIRWGTCNSPDVESRATNALIHLIEFHETFGCKFHYTKEAAE
jgi:hypothetical protein